MGRLRFSKRAYQFVRSVVQIGQLAPRLDSLSAQNTFLLHEVRRLAEQNRLLVSGADLFEADDRVETRASFDYQWQELNSGAGLATDADFMSTAAEVVCAMTDLPPEWFEGKRVVDVGCGAGRFTLAMLGMGARVTACDQSEWGLRQVEAAAGSQRDALTTQRMDLLEWDGVDDFDLAFCYGVVHHTGDTYRAIRNVCRKVRSGGRIFLMVYGLPVDTVDFRELNEYESLRQELRLASFEERQAFLLERFGPDLAHGYFDAVSPRINDLLSFEEIAEVLARLGFHDARLTIPSRNHHVVANKALQLD